MANETQAKPQPQRIPLAKIHDLPGVFIAKQPDKSYGGLVTSIQANGVKEAVILRLREDGEYQLVTGYRRRRASELAKQQDIPAYIYEMTLQEAIAYHRQVKMQPNAPIPGKLVELSAKAEKSAEPIVPGKGSKTEAAPKAEGKVEKPTTPAEAPKEAGKTAATVKPEAPAKDEKATEPTAPGKDGKTEAAPKTEDKETKPTSPAEKSKVADKATEPAKPETPAKDEKATEPAVPGKDEATPKTEDKEKNSATPAEQSKETDKATEPAKPETPAKDEKATEPAVPGKDGKAEATPKTEDKEEKPTTPAEKSKVADKATEPAKPETPAKDEKAAEPTAPGKDIKAEAAPKTEGKETKPEKAAVTGPAALGPAGTAITKIFEQRLAPPTEQELKNLPVPKEGESFFITLHPGYLAKSKFNTFSVDTNSDNFKELRKSVELVGIKDPVLTRINPEGSLEILSGQRRHLAAAELNYPVPAIIQKIDDADAKIIVADGNLHRDKISTYDLSRALRMKMEGMKQKSGRRKKDEIKAEELDSDEKLAKEMGMSVSKLNRIIRLSEAVKDVCDRVDDGSLALSIASAISFLKPANQDEVLHLMDLNYKVTNDRVERMKKVEKTGKLDEHTMREILEDRDIAPKKVIPPTPTPAPAAPTASPPAPTSTPSMAPTTIPASPDVKPAAPTVNEPAPTTPVTSAVSTTPTPPTSTVPEKEPDVFKGAQERPENTKVILTGDRLRRYFPDVNMTPREIEESVYEALEERRQRQVKIQQKNELFKKSGPTR